MRWPTDEINTSALPSPSHDDGDDSDAVKPSPETNDLDTYNSAVDNHTPNLNADSNNSNRSNPGWGATSKSLSTKTASVSPPPMFSSVQISEMGSHNPFPSNDDNGTGTVGNNSIVTDKVHSLYDQQSMDQNPSSQCSPETTNPFDDSGDDDKEQSPPPPVNILDVHSNGIAKGFTEDFNGINMSPVGIPPPVYSNDNINLSNSTTKQATEPTSAPVNQRDNRDSTKSNNSYPFSGASSSKMGYRPHGMHAATDSGIPPPPPISELPPDDMTNSVNANASHPLQHSNISNISNVSNPMVLPKRISTEPELFRLRSPNTQQQHDPHHGLNHGASSLHNINSHGSQHGIPSPSQLHTRSLPATPENGGVQLGAVAAFSQDSVLVSSHQSQRSHSRGKSARIYGSKEFSKDSVLRVNKMQKGRSADDMMGSLAHKKGQDLLQDVSFDDVLGQAVVGVEMSDRLKEVIRKFCKHQQMGADKLQEIYTKLPPTYKDLDGMKDFADLCALVHELILQTVSAQKRLADFLVKDVVPRMDAHIKVCHRMLCGGEGQREREIQCVCT